MDRRTREGRERSVTSLALLLSVAAHAALLAWVGVEVSGADDGAREPSAALRAAPSPWVERPLEIVRVRPTAGEGVGDPARARDPAPGAVAPRRRAAEPAGASGTVTARLPLRPAPAPAARGLDLTPIAAGPTGGAALGEGEAAGETARAGARRGVILRDRDARGAARGEWDFRAASEAAREAERRRRGGDGSDREGIRGVLGGGGRCPTPGGAPPRPAPQRPPTSSR